MYKLIILKHGIVLLLDLILFLSCGVVLFILLTGGGVYQIGRFEITAFTYSNGLYGMILCVILRIIISRTIPFLHISQLSFEHISERARRLCFRLYERLNSLEPVEASRFLVLIVAVSLSIKLANAWFYYGFVTGDDVEIQEMSFAKLFGWDWTAWNLRNPFYPLTFIYPAQLLMKASGIKDAKILIFSGRLVVALFSCLNLWMVFKIAKHKSSKVSIGLLACFFLAISKLHTNYGSSELPRTVSSFFLLLAMWWVLQRNRSLLRLILAGAAVGVSSAIRFSEAIFLVPFILLIVQVDKVRNALIFTIAFTISAAFILGFSDLLYWKKPFYSLFNIVDFVLVKRLVTRGRQPFYYYVTHFYEWTNLAFISILLLSLRSIPRSLLNFIWIPIVLLSLFVHKEPRYLLPVLPFFAICLAAAFWNLLVRIHLQIKNGFGRVSIWGTPSMLIFLLAVGILFELDGFRFRRTEDAVDLARFLNAKDRVSNVAIQQIWASGDRLYMNRIKHLEDISPVYVGNLEYIQAKIRSPKVQFVALQKKDLKRYGYLKLLLDHGYREVSFPTNPERNHYRLFQHINQ